MSDRDLFQLLLDSIDFSQHKRNVAEEAIGALFKAGLIYDDGADLRLTDKARSWLLNGCRDEGVDDRQ